MGEKKTVPLKVNGVVIGTCEVENLGTTFDRDGDVIPRYQVDGILYNDSLIARLMRQRLS